jgi:ribonuclease D
MALDVEFIREETYVPQLALIQMAVEDVCAIIDPLAVDDLTPLRDLLDSPDVLKVLHAPAQDLEILYWHLGRLPVHLFDTQTAAALVGLGEQLSYGHLVKRLLHMTLPKGESYSKWMQRPLTPAQIAYALDDVRYLLPLHELLTTRLEEMGRAAWAREEFRKFENPERYGRDPGALFRRIRRGRTLGPEGLAILRELVVWRDQEAQQRDKPPGGSRPQSTAHATRAHTSTQPAAPRIRPFGSGSGRCDSAWHGRGRRRTPAANQASPSLPYRRTDREVSRYVPQSALPAKKFSRLVCRQAC